MERTLVMIKPDGVQRELIGEVISRMERRGYKIIALKMIQLSSEMARQHYIEHVGKPFLPRLIDFITSGPVVVMVVEGCRAISGVRSMMGATNPSDALPGSIRHTYAQDIGRNVIHGSAESDAAVREIALYFSPDEMVDYHLNIEPWLEE